jgi:hypothetical protein
MGRDSLVRTAGMPGWWVEVAEGQSDRFGDLSEKPGAIRMITAALVIGALIALLVIAARRGRRDVAAAAACALVLLAGVTMVASSTPTTGITAITLGYTLWWASTAGLFAWLVLIWGGAQILGWPRLAGRARGRGVAVLAVAGTAVAVVTLVRAGAGEDVLRTTYEPMRQIAGRVEGLVRPGQTVLVGTVGVSSGFDNQYDYEMGIVYTLRRHGAEPVMRDARLLGSRYEVGDRRVDTTILVGPEGKDPGRGARQIARVPIEGREPAVVWQLPGR